MIEIRVEAGQTINTLEQAQSLAPLKPAMDRSVARIQRFMAQYPPQRPRTRYRRSGTLGRRWATSVEARSTELRGLITNPTAYGPYVQGQLSQAWMHQNIWQTDVDAIVATVGEIMDDFSRTITAMLRTR